MNASDVFLKDALAASLLDHAGRSQAARELLALLRNGGDHGDDAGNRPRAEIGRAHV